jgi:hypothetical protein
MKVKELKTDECIEVLKKSKLARIACSFENQPYIVPLMFSYRDGDYLYAFSTLGQKILWMRQNPLVCVEVEEIKSQEDWTTLVIFGRYEELTETPEFEAERNHAHELLAGVPGWWQPAYFAGAQRDELEEIPVYFRISIEKITGYRALMQDFEKYIPIGQPIKLKKKRKASLW